MGARSDQGLDPAWDPAREVFGEVSGVMGARGFSSWHSVSSRVSVDSLRYLPVILGFALHKHKGSADKKQLGR